MTLHPFVRRAALATAAAVVVAAAGLAGMTPASAEGVPTTLAAGHVLSAGQSLRSPDGRYLLTVLGAGRARLMRAERVVWRTPSGASGSVLRLTRSGNLTLFHGGTVAWQSNTRGAGPSRLAVSDSGAVVIEKSAGTVWSSALGNGCRSATPRREVRVDISRQRAWFCARGQQILTTPVTTGAVDRGDATPTGRWKIYERTRNTTLYPASGGAYPVHFWMPYDGAYGLHDAPWQHFPYGSGRYRSHGSHGCVHVPEKAMRLLFHWAPVGTTVLVHH